MTVTLYMNTRSRQEAVSRYNFLGTAEEAKNEDHCEGLRIKETQEESKICHLNDTL